LGVAVALDQVVAAATQPLTNALWQPAHHGEMDQVTISALRSALERLPAGDSEQRCRVMLGLAGEIYYGATPLEREALAEEAMAMARRLGDPGLLLWTLLSAATTIWRGGNARQRLELTAEAATIAQALGDGTGLSSALTLHTVAAGELGMVSELDGMVAAARAEADRQRHLYAHLVLDAFELSWCGMRGEFDEVDRLLADIVRLGERMSLAQFGDALNGALAMKMVWQGEHEALVAVVGDIEATSFLPVASTIAAMLCRVGRVEDAREFLSRREIDMDLDSWFSPMMWSMAAEASAYVGVPELAASAYAHLSPLRGHVACAGSGTALGPVDAFLAMAASAAGERDLAVQHADDATRLCEEWRIPVAAAWFAGVRETFGL
jgi:hypothetical protein